MNMLVNNELCLDLFQDIVNLMWADIKIDPIIYNVRVKSILYALITFENEFHNKKL
jgi:hypothetical protein